MALYSSIRLSAWAARLVTEVKCSDVGEATSERLENEQSLSLQ